MRADRLQVRIDQEVVGLVGGVAQIDLFDVGAGAGGARHRRMPALNRRPVEGVERHVVRHRVLGAEQAARHFQLGGVVEDPEAAVALPRAVALDVPGEAGARRDLFAEAELDALVALRVRRDLFLVGAQAKVERHVLADRPRVLQEQAEPVGVDVARVVDAGHGVVAVGAAHVGPAVERVAAGAPEQVDRRVLRAAEPLELPIRSY